MVEVVERETAACFAVKSIANFDAPMNEVPELDKGFSASERA
jgi:hypothetical protein